MSLRVATHAGTTPALTSQARGLAISPDRRSGRRTARTSNAAGTGSTARNRIAGDGEAGVDPGSRILRMLSGCGSGPSLG